jgi:molybdate transport system substrate-binding protein
MKKWSMPMVIALAAMLILAAGCGGTKQTPPPAAAQPVELTISAAVSLKDALAEIQANYQKISPNVKLTFNLGASGSLQKQIEQGAPADIFISAAPKQMNELEAKNMISKASRKDLVENKLVLIVPQESKLGLASFEDLSKASVQKLSVGEPAVVPAGQYAREALQKLGLWDKLKDKIVYAKDVRTVLTYVETGNVEAGIVYKTDAAASGKVKIAATAPADSHQPVVYPAAVLAGSKQPKAAEEFLNYLAGPDGMKVFVKYGFSPMGAKQ